MSPNNSSDDEVEEDELSIPDIDDIEDEGELLMALSDSEPDQHQQEEEDASPPSEAKPTLDVKMVDSFWNIISNSTEFYLTRVYSQTSSHRISDWSRLLVNLLEHKMLVAPFLKYFKL